MIEFVPYKGWSRCCRLSNDVIELIATLDVGPRIIRFGFAGGDNFFKEFPDDLGQTGGEQFRFYGGHRLWHAPESQPRTYYPDNLPVNCETRPEGVRLIQAVEATTGIQKEIEIRLAPHDAKVELVHRLHNNNLWAVRLAPWALTALTGGGTAVIPLPPRGEHASNLLPTAAFVIWAYTDLSDPRWMWGREHILVRQDPSHTTPQKIGLPLPDGWLAYAWNGSLFVKRFPFQPQGVYPDWGSSAEVFVNGEMLELESLGPMVELEPGQTLEYPEVWELYSNIATPNEGHIDSFWQELQPNIQEIVLRNRPVR